MVKKGNLWFMSGWLCGSLYHIEDGKIVKAEPDKESPKGRLCPRGIGTKIFFMGRSVSNVH